MSIVLKHFFNAASSQSLVQTSVFALDKDYASLGDNGHLSNKDVGEITTGQSHSEALCEDGYCSILSNLYCGYIFHLSTRTLL